ncbi:MAG TPA: hypothetical protein VFI11_00730 [Anaerolineales bacterium]|nr:hypothetical protein [Anaerolineales bacterium]
MGDVRSIAPAERHLLAPLLDLQSAGDASAAYYALRHPAERVELLADFAGANTVRGFLAIARTGLDLFRPVATPFAAHPSALHNLLRAGLRPGQPVLLFLPVEQQPWVEGLLELSEVKIMNLLRLDPGVFEPVLNVLVTSAQSPEGLPRFEVRTPGGLHAASGVNWKGDRFAEVYVESDAEGRARGFARSVLAAMVGQLLSERLIALYRVDELDTQAAADAHRAGFRRTGERTLVGQALLRLATREPSTP